MEPFIKDTCCWSVHFRAPEIRHGIFLISLVLMVNLFVTHHATMMYQLPSSNENIPAFCCSHSYSTGQWFEYQPRDQLL
jgi:hypothetical protein